MSYTYNPKLRTIKPDWQGTPVDRKDRFTNIEFPFTPKTVDVLKWMLSRNPQKEEKKQDDFRLRHSNETSFLSHDKDCIVWLGHASFFLRVNGVDMLIDPVFYKVPFVRRYSDHAFSPQTFTSLRYLLISHDHQDHCQEKSIRHIINKNPSVEILTGLKMESLLRRWSKENTIQTAGWYQQYITDPSIEIFFLPSRHWSKRGMWDDNMRLWGAFVVRSATKTIYFCGDSGYGGHFAEVKSLFKKVDVAIMGIGAYKPEWFMHPNHISPHDAVRAFNDMDADILIPMHYGTFDVSYEPVGEPLRKITQLEKENGINGKLIPLQPGEAFIDF